MSAKLHVHFRHAIFCLQQHLPSTGADSDSSCLFTPKKQVLYIICLSMLDLVVDMLRALIDAMYFKIAFNIFFTLRQVDFYSGSKKKETIFGNLSIITSQNSCLNDIMTILN